MKDQFVHYELALQMKELGFDEECFSAYTDHFEKNKISMMGLSIYELGFFNCEKQCLAPLWQQAFDWFSDKKRMSSHIIEHNEGRIYWRIILKGNKTGTAKGYSKFEKSRQEARFECLKKLIELCKKN